MNKNYYYYNTLFVGEKAVEAWAAELLKLSDQHLQAVVFAPVEEELSDEKHELLFR